MIFEILEREGDQVLWRVNGEDGATELRNGRAYSTYLCDGPFDLKPGLLRVVADEVNKWLDEERKV